MARDFFINGETMVSVKGNVDSAIASLSQLGLADSPIRVRLDFRHMDIQVDAWGGEIPADVQCKLGSAIITMTMVHFDRDVLDGCLRESMGGVSLGTVARAGIRMGGGNTRFAGDNHYIGLNLASPVSAKVWRFHYCYLTGPPMEFPLGTERSIVALNWRAIPYTTDPWGAGVGAAGASLWDHTADT